MKGTKFTPAPWQWQYQPDEYGVDSDEIYVSHCGVALEICRIDPGMVAAKENERIANANLISAAPNMYEALEKLEEMFYSFANINSNERETFFEESTQLIEQALSKARGEKQAAGSSLDWARPE